MRVTANKGTRVTPTEAFFKQFPRSTARIGIVLGPARDGKCIRIKWDGLATPQVMHTSFVRPILTDPEMISEAIARLRNQG